MSRSAPQSRTTLHLCLASLGLITPIASQVVGPRHVTRPSEARELRLDARSYWQDRLIVKFAEGYRVRLAALPPNDPNSLRASSLASSDLDLRRVQGILGLRRVERVFTRTPQDLEAERQALVARAEQLGVAPPPRLDNYYRVYTKGRDDTIAILRALLDEAAVETAFPEFHPGAHLPAQATRVPSVPHDPEVRGVRLITPQMESLQSYLDAAPNGLGVRPALGVLGSEGNPGQKIVQIEAAWILGHEDLPQLKTANVIGKRSWGTYDTIHWRNHGTAACGILSASRDHRGVRGVVPLSQLYVCSIANGDGNAVSLATKIAGAGDVFTSSVVYAVYYQSKGFHAPFDLRQDVYDAIRVATLKGIVVTIPAGNTGVDLARKELYGTRYLSTSSPSGAWITGASLTAKTTRVQWSNFGGAVGLSAWGAKVATCGYGFYFRGQDAPERRSYTDIFGGTSATAPQVAAVAASIQSIAKSHFGVVVPTGILLNQLQTYGTPVQGGIGPRPNQILTLRSLRLVAGLLQEGEAQPGKFTKLSLELRKGEMYVLFGGVISQRFPTTLFRFPLMINPVGMLRLWGGAVSRTPEQLHVPVPDWAPFYGAHVYYQVLRIDPRTMNLDLTNALDSWVRGRKRDT